MNSSVSNTASAAFGAAGGSQLIIWIFACIQAEHVIPPTNDEAVMLGSILVPIAHLLFKAFVVMLERITGADLDGSNTPPAPAAAPAPGVAP